MNLRDAVFTPLIHSATPREALVALLCSLRPPRRGDPSTRCRHARRPEKHDDPGQTTLDAGAPDPHSVRSTT